ncbi:MAG TPA: DUF2064 domain-containing protein [Wenzhouxiangella sp.]|nr:DUF2064 domain-containing protein [Wenzhouxiangella sp.]
MTAIAIFVKTPGFSPVKSRLAAAVGTDLAEACHLRCARTVAAVARSAAVGPVYWAVAEPAALEQDNWSDLPVLTQPKGGLGVRMKSIQDELIRRHGRGLLLGADLPQVNAASLRTAHNWLAGLSKRGVIGPATDGGFWLVGANSLLPAAVWNEPIYGKNNALRSFLAGSADRLDWQQLATFSDLDLLEDVPAVVSELENLPHTHPEQLRLLDWLSKHLIKPD